MKKYPIALRGRSPRKVEPDAVDVIRPRFDAGSFFRFQYSYTEMTAAGDRARVKARRARYEDGKLTSETFEGDCDRTEYDRMVSEAQRYFLGQTELFLKSLAFLLPFSPRARRDRD